jgi:hypothetical protein
MSDGSGTQIIPQIPGDGNNAEREMTSADLRAMLGDALATVDRLQWFKEADARQKAAIEQAQNAAVAAELAGNGGKGPGASVKRLFRGRG